jgi:hypothetical protein
MGLLRFKLIERKTQVGSAEKKSLRTGLSDAFLIGQTQLKIHTVGTSLHPGAELEISW